MQDWVTQSKAEDKMKYRLTEEMVLAIDRFYFNHYCQAFRSGAFARANSSMYVYIYHLCVLSAAANGVIALVRPMLNMCGTFDCLCIYSMAFSWNHCVCLIL